MISVFICIVVALVCWVIITIIGLGAEKKEKTDIRSDATNVLLSSLGYVVVFYACLNFKSAAISWVAVVGLGLLALIPVIGAIALIVKREVSLRRMLSASIASLVPVFVVIEIFISCLS